MSYGINLVYVILVATYICVSLILHSEQMASQEHKVQVSLYMFSVNLNGAWKFQFTQSSAWSLSGFTQYL